MVAVTSLSSEVAMERLFISLFRLVLEWVLRYLVVVKVMVFLNRANLSYAEVLGFLLMSHPNRLAHSDLIRSERASLSAAHLGRLIPRFLDLAEEANLTPTGRWSGTFFAPSSLGFLVCEPARRFEFLYAFKMLCGVNGIYAQGGNRAHSVSVWLV